jgi:isopenicillin-N epimerase
MKSFFYDDKNEIYLNSGTQSRPPLEVINDVNQLRQKSYTNPTEMHVLFPESLYQVHLNFSNFVNCIPEDLFFCHNVTESLNHFILGSKLTDSAEIFTLDLEYGATLNICKFRSEKDNRKLSLINISQFFKDQSNTEEELNSLIINLISELSIPEGSMFIMSHVLTSNGFVLPIKEISKILNDKNVLSIVDGAHAIGAFKIDLSDFDLIDFYGGNLHKWLLGLAGTGFGWVNPNTKYKCDSLFRGWPNYENAEHLDDFKLSGTAKEFYLKGTIDFAQFMAINSLLNWWKKHGEQNIYQLRRNYRNELVEGLSKNPEISLLSTQVDKSPLLSYKLSTQYSNFGSKIATDLFNDFKLSIATPTMNGETVLRLSPNVYNNSEEIKKSIKILNNYLK